MEQSNICVWVTGLSGSGKTTLARYLLKESFFLNNKGILLDGDEIREALSSLDVGYSVDERKNIAFSYAKIAKLLYNSRFFLLLLLQYLCFKMYVIGIEIILRGTMRFI